MNHSSGRREVNQKGKNNELGSCRWGGREEEEEKEEDDRWCPGECEGRRGGSIAK